MKKNIFKAFAAVLAAGSLASCSSDYLELAPQTTISQETAVSTPEGTSAALNGMYLTQYMSNSIFGDGSHRMFNGECWVNNYYGEAFGSDYYSLYFASDIYSTYIVNWEGMNVDNYWFCQPAWIYYYTIINQANNILNGIDKCDAGDAYKDVVRAQCRAMRAHCYTRLLQIHGPRWEDSNNGATKVLVNRIDDGNTGASPLVDMSVTLNLIYEDLNFAIKTLEANNYKKDFTYSIDAQTAKGYLARAALLKHDYKLAQQMAKEARAGHEIMSGEQYLNGFTYANQEYICYIAPQDMMPVGYSGANWITGCNGPYMDAWKELGAGAISYDLYRQMDENDVRRALFWTPDKMAVVGYPKWNTDGFWDTKYVNEGTMDMSNPTKGMYSNIRKYAQNEKLAGARNPSFPGAYTPYTSTSGSDNVVVPFGGQFKFWGWNQYGTGDVCLMRAAEMLLTEAEAAYYNGDYATVQANLTELNSKRVPGYTCTKTGEALLKEYKLSRRLELWGEGFCWFDLKRWNEPMTRRAWVKGDPTSNNIPAFNAITVEPSEYHGWRFAMPVAEPMYNDDVTADEYWPEIKDELPAIQRMPRHLSPVGIKF